jgi:hypothetical protein
LRRPLAVFRRAVAEISRQTAAQRQNLSYKKTEDFLNESVAS